MAKCEYPKQGYNSKFLRSSDSQFSYKNQNKRVKHREATKVKIGGYISITSLQANSTIPPPLNTCQRSNNFALKATSSAEATTVP